MIILLVIGDKRLNVYQSKIKKNEYQLIRWYFKLSLVMNKNL